MAAAEEEEEVRRLAEFFEGLNVEEHRSVEVGGGIAREFSADRHKQMRAILDLVVHAFSCHQSPPCPYPNCRKVKGLLRHGVQCKTRYDGGCRLCWKMWYLLKLHAEECQESECIVPRCRDLKEHLERKQQQLQEQQGSMQQQQLLEQQTMLLQGNIRMQ